MKGERSSIEADPREAIRRRVPFVIWVAAAALGPLAIAGLMTLTSRYLHNDYDGTVAFAGMYPFVIFLVRASQIVARWMALGPGKTWTRIVFGPLLLTAILASTIVFGADEYSRGLFAVAGVIYVGLQLLFWIGLALCGERDRAPDRRSEPTQFAVRHALMGLASLSLLLAVARFAFAGAEFANLQDDWWIVSPLAEGAVGLFLFSIDVGVRFSVAAAGAPRRGIGIGVLLPCCLLFLIPVSMLGMLGTALAVGALISAAIYLAAAASYDVALRYLGYRAMNVRFDDGENVDPNCDAATDDRYA